MKQWKRALCLLLCLSLTGAAGVSAWAVELPDFSAYLEKYDGLFDGVVDSLDGLKNGQDFQLGDKLRGVIERYDLDSFGADLKEFLNNSAEMSDEALADSISGLAADHGITLTDSQLQQLCTLCRKLEKLDADALQDKLEGLRETVDQAEKERETVSGFFQVLRNSWNKVSVFLRGWLSRIKSRL